MDSESPRPAIRMLKVVIAAIFYGITESRRMLMKAVGRTPPRRATVIYYHHVLNDQRERFARQLDHLMRWARPLSADFGTLPDTESYAIVTADDGWKSFADNAVPELERRNIPVTVFAISNRLGGSVDGIEFDRLVTPDELRALDSRGVIIGSHTASHAVMTSLGESEACGELRESREQLAAILSHDVRMFCFPYGRYSAPLIPLCREAGYDRVFTCDPQSAVASNFVVGRVRVDPTDWPLEFHLKLMGAYRWLPAAVALKRRLRAAIRRGSSASSSAPGVPA